MRIKRVDPNTVERFNPTYNEGLSEEQVSKRKEQGLINKTNTQVGKTHWEIIRDNVLTFFNIMLPLAQNALIIVLVSGFYNVWGEYTISKTLASKDSIMPISVALTLLKSEDWNYGVLAAAITLSIIPPIVVFAVFQDKLVEGMSAGAIKG